MGAFAQAAREDRARAERGTALVDHLQRLLRQRRDAHRSAPLRLGRNEADRTPRTPARILPVHADRLGLLLALRTRRAADPSRKRVLRCRPFAAPLLPAQRISG